MRTIAVIPCLNEEKYITEVVKGTKRYVDLVLVSAGGSIDKTVELAEAAGAKVYIEDNVTKRGFRANLKAGINWVLDKENSDIIVILDGDGQHDTSEIPKLLRPILKGEADVVMGCRMGQEGMPRYRRIGNRLLSFVCNLGNPIKSPDAVCGFWAIKKQAVPHLTEKKWGVCIEMLMKIRSNGNRLVYVPIRPIYHREYSENSTVPPLDLALIILWAIIKWRIKCEIFHVGRLDNKIKQ